MTTTKKATAAKRTSKTNRSQSTAQYHSATSAKATDSNSATSNTQQQAAKPTAKSHITHTRYPLNELIANAQQLFDVKSEVLHGVFYDAEQTSFTIQEVQQHIQQFMKAKVK